MCFVRTQSHVLAALFFERYFLYFGSLHPAFEMSCDTEYLKKQLLIFFGNVVSVVLYCVQRFWWFSHKPSEKNGRLRRKQNTKFPRRRWVSSKNVFLSTALLFSLVVTKKYVLRISWSLYTWSNRCFLFKGRVLFQVRQLLKARFGTLALYILRLRCLVIWNIYKSSSFSWAKQKTSKTT